MMAIERAARLASEQANAELRQRNSALLPLDEALPWCGATAHFTLCTRTAYTGRCQYDGRVVEYSSTNEPPHLVRFDDGKQHWLHLGTQLDGGNLSWLDGLGNILQEPQGELPLSLCWEETLHMIFF